MDVIGQAIAVGVRVTIWMFQWLFELSTMMTYKSFGGLYQRSQTSAWGLALGVWILVWTVVLGLAQGTNGALGGLVVGLAWGVFCVMRVREVWEEDMVLIAMENPQPPEVFSTPVMPIQEAGPMVLNSDFGTTEPVEKE